MIDIFVENGSQHIDIFPNKIYKHNFREERSKQHYKDN